jgi:CheY-like chemotaxis protein
METPHSNIKLIAVARGIMSNNKTSPDMEYIYSPLTSLLLLHLLSGINNIKSNDNKNDRTQVIQLYDTNLLVVDDIDINLIIAEEILIAYGCKVDTANSGTEAIKKIKENHYDLVFMDHMMPGLDGVDTTKAIRNFPEEKYKTLPIIALTANVVGNVRDKLLESGMSDFLSKPLEEAEIIRVLREWLPQEKLIVIK